MAARTLKRKASKGTKKAAKRAAPRKTVRHTKRKAPLAFFKPVHVDAALGAIVGDKPQPRSAITKKLWVHIKKLHLQDPKKMRMIRPDAKLAKVIGSAPIDMLKMTAKVSKHIKA